MWILKVMVSEIKLDFFATPVFYEFKERLYKEQNCKRQSKTRKVILFEDWHSIVKI
jgi:hypothetical protein